MGQARGDLDLAQEPLGAERRGDLGPEHFERDAAAVLQVGGEVNRRHPAMSELALDPVTPGEGGLEADRQIGHAMTRGRGTTT
ncbi:MAG TPA: hypothetical protein VFD76_03370 [Gemmatimonadales bacterium]|nr:hypothetical protein [Gemmatimonadales bacterium]